MSASEFAGKKVAVIGLAATGLATAQALASEGAIVTVCDAQPEAALSAERLAEIRALGIGLRLGTAELPAESDLVVPSPGVPRAAPPLADAVRRGVPVLGEIEIAYRLASAPILAITGTNGKTTTTALLGAICRAANRPTWVAGNIAEDAGKRLPLIQAAVEAPADAVIVAEISSFQLEWVERFRPKVGAWLNVANDHLDRHPDFDDYARTKARLFAAQTDTDFAVLNADDANVLRYAEGVGNGQRRRFSLADAPPVPADAIPLPGKHNRSNVLAATAMATAFGIPIDAIRTGILEFRGVAHRMEFVASIDGVRFVNNSMCTNPVAVAASLDAAGDGVVAIIGGRHKGGDLSGMARAVHENARAIVLIGEAAPQLADALAAEGRSGLPVASSLPEAVTIAAAMARPGDTVILAPGCSSFDMFTGFEQRGQVFRDAVQTLQRERERRTP